MEERKEILVVEDDQDALDALVEVLNQAGYKVAGASTFDEGRRALASRPDMLVTDIRLGAYNGLQLVVRARVANPDIFAVVLTGYHDVVLQAETERLNAIYMRKPVDVNQMLASIAEAFTSA
jgi:two-component system response regulator RegA